jgi:hypothetical protein
MPEGPWAGELKPGSNTARLTVVSEDKGKS